MKSAELTAHWEQMLSDIEHGEAGKEQCGFFIFGQDKRIGRSYTSSEIRELLSVGKITLRNCTSSRGKKYSAAFVLEDTGQYVNLRFVEFVNDRKRRTAG